MTQQTRIETLRGLLRESQQVKTNLENKLSEQRKKRRGKESELSAVNGKLAQTKNLWMKTQEARDIAHQKTKNSQNLADSLEKEIKRKRDLVQKVENDITKFKENRDTEVEKFEEDLSTMSKQFKSAKKGYSEAVLNQKIKDAEVRHEEILVKVKKVEEDEININTANYLKSLQMEQPLDTEENAVKDIVGNITTDEKTRLEAEFVIIMQEEGSTRE